MLSYRTIFTEIGQETLFFGLDLGNSMINSSLFYSSCISAVYTLYFYLYTYIVIFGHFILFKKSYYLPSSLILCTSALQMLIFHADEALTIYIFTGAHLCVVEGSLTSLTLTPLTYSDRHIGQSEAPADLKL